MHQSSTISSQLNDIQNLDELIEYAYHIFCQYRPHRPLEVCTYCCMYDKNVEQIYQTPLKKLSREIIYDYLDAAQGESLALSDEMRYFIPRIFELLAKGEHLRHSTELVLDKCHLKMGVWTASEMAVMEHFSLLFLKDKFSKAYENFHYIEIFSYIVMFYLSGLDNTKELLKVILDFLDNDNLLLNLCGEFYYSFKENYYHNSFSTPQLNEWIYDWENQPVNRQLILQKLLLLTQSPMYHQLDNEKRYWVDCMFDRLSSK